MCYYCIRQLSLPSQLNNVCFAPRHWVHCSCQTYPEADQLSCIRLVGYLPPAHYICKDCLDLQSYSLTVVVIRKRAVEPLHPSTSPTNPSFLLIWYFLLSREWQLSTSLDCDFEMRGKYTDSDWIHGLIMNPMTTSPCDICSISKLVSLFISLKKKWIEDAELGHFQLEITYRFAFLFFYSNSGIHAVFCPLTETTSPHRSWSQTSFTDFLLWSLEKQMFVIEM